LFAAFAKGTHSTYAAGLLRFTQFCDKSNVPENARMPAPHYLLAAFLAEYTGTVSGATTKGWMSGLKAWHDLNGAKWEGEDRWVELARRTANKEGTAFKRDQRGPVTIQHMIALRATLNLDDPFDAAVWALACAAFWSCRRLGELTVRCPADFDPKYHIARGAVPRRIRNSNTRATALHLPWTKSTRERGGTMTLTVRDDDLCPEAAYDNHMRVNATVPSSAPLFAFRNTDGSWSYMTKDWFITRCDKIWATAGLLAVFGHSFRIGGSTELLLAGVPCEVVAALGGWTSLAFLLYWRRIEHIVPMNVGKAYDKNKLNEVANVGGIR
jgi:hypothetical protein